MKKIIKPWGYELIWVRTKKYVGKVLHINKGETLSLQYHKIKDESIYVMRGLIELQIKVNKKLIKKKMKQNAYQRIKPKTIHRMRAIKDSDVIELSTPELNDVVRLEDKYGRVK